MLIRRYLLIWRGDRQALLAMIGQSVLVAVLLGSVFGNLADVSNPAERVPRTDNLLLLLTVSCFWFGCNSAAKELVKERVIFLRERDFNLRVGDYPRIRNSWYLLSSPWAQATLLFMIVQVWCRPPGSAALQWVTLTPRSLLPVQQSGSLSRLVPARKRWRRPWCQSRSSRKSSWPVS